MNATLRHSARFGLTVTFLLALAAAPARAQDQVTLRSGLVLHGELKSLSRAKVSFDSPELDIVSIDVEDVVRIASPNFVEVVSIGGLVYRGSLADAGTGMLVIVGAGRADTISIANVATILRFDHTFWGRTSGYLNIGFNLAQANALKSALIGSRFAYHGLKWGFSLDEDAYWQRQEATDTAGTVFEQSTRRLSLGTALTRFVEVRWSVQGLADYERNDELNLDSRIKAGLGAQYELAETQQLELRAGAGLTSNTEQYVGQAAATSAEATANGLLDIFDLGKLDIYAAVTVYRPLGNADRLRLDFDGRITWEVIEDFFIGFTAVERLDSQPPLAGARKRDYQYGFTIGWSWQ